jgi:hypothetical protein
MPRISSAGSSSNPGPSGARPILLPSSDPALLAKAERIARAYVEPYLREDVAGVVFLGAIARGYFDAFADIDVAVFPERRADIPPPEKFTRIEGIEVQCWWSDYEAERAAPWDMSKRWTYSQRRVVHDPRGKIRRLLEEKVPLAAEERKRLAMAAYVLSEWYANRLADLWLARGSLAGAHQMIHYGLDRFLELLFVLNGRLVPDVKWRLFLADRLPRLPGRFPERIVRVLTLSEISREELELRRGAFLEMWRELMPFVEEEIGMTYAEMQQLV